MNKKVLIIFLAFLISKNLFSQTTYINNINDASSLLESYFSPLAEGFGEGLNNGWYNTAKPHKPLGFDVTFTLNTVSIPNESINFDPSNIPGNNFSGNETPTILGSGNGSVITYSDSYEFQMPNQGKINKNLIPVPMINAGIGLIKKTELDFRYLPNYNFSFGFAGDGSVHLWGIGLKHDLMQYIPIVGNAVPLDLSIQFGHTELNTKFNYKPSSNIKQEVDLNISATTFNIIASKKILMFTGHASIGYNTNRTVFNTNTSGKFNFGDSEFNIPVDLDFNGLNKFRTNLGVRVNLALLAIQLNHTFSEYPVTTLGVGIGIR